MMSRFLGRSPRSNVVLMIGLVAALTVIALLAAGTGGATTSKAGSGLPSKFKIGVNMALTGATAPYDQPALAGLKMAVSEINAKGGLHGRPIQLFTLDDAYEAKKAVANGNLMISDVRDGKGSLGKLATDDELYNKLRDSSNNLASATAKLNDNTTTAGKLFSDPKLYDNLTGLTGDLRLLIGDFRQNPKKFLRIKVAVF